LPFYQKVQIMICTIYSRETGFNRVMAILRQVYPKAVIELSEQDEFQIAMVELKGGLFSAAKTFKIGYRERKSPSLQLMSTDDCPLCVNLKGMYGLVGSLPTTLPQLKDQLLRKIQTLNCEFSVIREQGEPKDIKELIARFAHDLDAILFVQPGTVISRSGGQHFLNKDLKLIIDGQGSCEIDHLDVEADMGVDYRETTELTEDQVERKRKSEEELEQRKFKINRNLPYIESEDETTIRSPKEIAERVVVLAVINLVAFDNIPPEEGIDYLEKYALWSLVTPGESEFLANPSAEKKTSETWKSECIWTLMWALKKIDRLGFPDELGNLENIPPEDYPIGIDKDPNDFIDSVKETRTKAEILDASDLYYRLDWACVDARINAREFEGANPGVVYERHYALNWLTNYMEAEWDDITCDT
jgi:hypothetical protein